MEKRKLILIMGILACLLVFGLGLSPAFSAEYPTKPIKLLVAYKAGGSTDAAARLLGVFMEKQLGQAVTVVNLPGAGGQVGWTRLVESKPDGYTIGFINLPAINLVYATRKKVPFHPVQSFAPVGCNISDPNTILVTKDSRFKNIKELLDYARANPGKLTAVADGPVSDDHLALVRIQEAAGVKFKFVPYHGGAPSMAALLGKHGDLSVHNVFDYIKHKEKLRGLAQLWPERYSMIPEIPTFEEGAGIKLVGSSTRGVAALAETPPDVLAKLQDAFKKATSDPEYLSKAEKMGLTLVEMTSSEFWKFNSDLQESVDKYKHFFVKK